MSSILAHARQLLPPPFVNMRPVEVDVMERWRTPALILRHAGNLNLYPRYYVIYPDIVAVL
jgi:hypothetical protein